MYATVRTYSGAAGLADALAARADDIRGVIAQIEGFRAYYLVRTEDGAVSVSVYDTEAGAQASVKAAADYLGQNLAEFATTPPAVSSGEVVLSL
jgi:heme-degrading monooxygenase HmoA